MKNVMQSVACGLLVGGLAGFGAACSPQPAGTLGSSTKLIPATIFLTATGVIATPCAAKVAPGRLQVKKNEDADWTIIDLCGGTKGYTVDVELKWSSANPSCSDGAKSPLDPSGGAPKGKQNIKRGINANCKAADVFSYEVWLDGVLLADPELEIMM